MEEMQQYKTTSQLSNEEQKEKLILDFFYLKSEINSIEKDKKNLSYLKKLSNSFEKNLESFLETEIPLKTKKDYVNFKKTKFDEKFLRLTKFL